MTAQVLFINENNLSTGADVPGREKIYSIISPRLSIRMSFSLVWAEEEWQNVGIAIVTTKPTNFFCSKLFSLITDKRLCDKISSVSPGMDLTA